MFSPFKNTILALVGIVLLFSFQVSFLADFSHEQSAISDISESGESSETEIENCELEKIFTHKLADFQNIQFSSHFTKQDSLSPQENFLEVPTSPPNA